MVRKFAYREHYFGKEADNPGLEAHFLHCLHALLQSLQCKYSTDVYLAAWIEGHDFPVVDFNVTRKCLDYEGDYNNWKPATSTTDAKFFGLRAPPGAVKMSQKIF